MTRLLALVAFLFLVGFLAILALEVPSPDLVLVVLLTVVLVAWDFVTAANKQ
ncbi:hypothetical protein QO034_15335 [Sedimentitalea sp. JM2-8]|uniref:Uncharacterized protein n=1 Tax=Sedimentitalea xiamensis TaxID=3050037 RepID=A0ABT7FH62_9RHOB|nr:hypothetical protein [Sedimentitalea xiamensis]MDK3074471.1 hypothetical protein [Sedimentitalea xiamensis]